MSECGRLLAIVHVPGSDPVEATCTEPAGHDGPCPPARVHLVVYSETELEAIDPDHEASPVTNVFLPGDEPPPPRRPQFPST